MASIRSRAGLLRGLAETWPLIPATLYLLALLCIVLLYLAFLGFSTEHAGKVIFPSLTTAQRVMSSVDFRAALYNTLLFALVGTPLELGVGILLALLLYRSFPFRNTVRSIFLIPLAVPALVTAILLFILFDYPGGHINHLLLGKYAFFPHVIAHPVNWRGSNVIALGVSLIGKVWRDMPISMLIILAGLMAIDPELLDAARTMGAGWRNQFRHVILPLIIPSMSAVVLLRSIEMWKEFIFPFVLAGRYYLLGTLIESLYNNWGEVREASFVALVLVACIVATTFAVLGLTELLKRWLTEKGGAGERA